MLIIPSGGISGIFWGEMRGWPLLTLGQRPTTLPDFPQLIYFNQTIADFLLIGGDTRITMIMENICYYIPTACS